MFAQWAKLIEEHGITPVALHNEENVIRAEAATWIGGAQGVLTLTNHRLTFHPRQIERPQERQETLEIPVGEITVFRLKRAFIGNAEHLEVGTVGHSPAFAVPNPQAWIEAIERAKHGAVTPAPTPAPMSFRL